MTDPRQPHASELRALRIRSAHGVLAIGALFLLNFLVGHYLKPNSIHLRPLTERQRDWLFVALGLAFSVAVVMEIREGATSFGRGEPTIRRSEHPIGFWACIALYGILAAATVIGPLGELLGLWNWI